MISDESIDSVSSFDSEIPLEELDSVYHFKRLAISSDCERSNRKKARYYESGQRNPRLHRARSVIKGDLLVLSLDHLPDPDPLVKTLRLRDFKLLRPMPSDNATVGIYRHLRTSKLLVIKSIYRHANNDPMRPWELVNEVNALVELQKNPFVIRYYGRIEEMHQIHLLMEWVKGPSLQDILLSDPSNDAPALLSLQRVNGQSVNYSVIFRTL